MKKRFMRATFEAPAGVKELSCFYRRNDVGQNCFSHFVIETVVDGRCIHRIEVHPWERKFNLWATTRLARQLCFGKKTNHVKL